MGRSYTPPRQVNEKPPSEASKLAEEIAKIALQVGNSCGKRGDSITEVLFFCGRQPGKAHLAKAIEELPVTKPVSVEVRVRG